MKKGGNAFDAGVATAFTLQVVEPHLNGPGGDVPIILHDQKRGKSEVICGQGPAPAGATIEHYKSLGLDLIPGTGHVRLAVGRDFGDVTPLRGLRVAHGLPFNGYIGASIEFKATGPGPWTWFCT